MALVLAGCASSSTGTTAITIPTATPLPQAIEPSYDPQTAIDFVAATQHAYLENANLQPFMSALSPDLRVEAARARKKQASDVHFDRRRLEVVYRWAATLQSRRTFEYKDEHVRQNGMNLSLEWKVHEKSVDAGDETAFGQIYDLEPIGGGKWRITRFRYWPLRPENNEEFGAKYFADADQKIEEARASSDWRNLAYWAMCAYRFDESSVAARRVTDASPEEAWGWDMRSMASALTGDLEDAISAGTRAKMLHEKDKQP